MPFNKKNSPFVQLLYLSFLFTSALLNAEIKVPGFFNDHMVLQRDIPVPIWGWAEPGEHISVKFADQEVSTKAKKDGTWMVKLQPMKANSKGQKLSISDINIQDVVVGEVWIASGQSNMQWRVQQSLNSEEEIAAANYPEIRQLNMARTAAYLPNTNAQGEWSICSPETAGNFTGVGYYFARKLFKEINVPIGIIDASWGGTGVEPWISQLGYNMIPEVEKERNEVNAGLPTSPTGKKKWAKHLTELEAWLPLAAKSVNAGKLPLNIPKRPSQLAVTHHGPTKIFNAMIHPLIPYAIRGVIWYQGESSWGQGPLYYYKKKALIEGWRQLWDQGNFPFYTVQLANLHPYNPKPEGGEGYAQIREAQRRLLNLKKTGLAVIYDIGNPTNIHPKNKQDVGARLAYWALAKEYGQNDLVYSGPLYENTETLGNEIHVQFSCVGSGLMIGKKEGLKPTQKVETELKGFAIAGSDKIWHWAKAKISADEKSVILTADQVKKPVAVRYAYRWNPIHSNLYNKEGLPASPFRTDQWEK